MYEQSICHKAVAWLLFFFLNNNFQKIIDFRMLWSMGGQWEIFWAFFFEVEWFWFLLALSWALTVYVLGSYIIFLISLKRCKTRDRKLLISKVSFARQDPSHFKTLTQLRKLWSYWEACGLCKDRSLQLEIIERYHFILSCVTRHFSDFDK